MGWLLPATRDYRKGRNLLYVLVSIIISRGKVQFFSTDEKKKLLEENMKGYIHVYTGNGKGKTTAAFVLALRAAGAGFL